MPPRLALTAGLAVALLASCTGSDGGNPTAISAVEPGTSLGGPADGPVLAPGEVFRAVSPSVVYVQTDWASGSGVVIEDGYVITNAHVIVPFGTVSISAPGDEPIDDVPVVGVDFAADLALLGPIADGLPAVELGSIDAVAPGDEVFLLGYPSETEEMPTPTIAEGIVSRLRHVDGWDQTYVQTDADIAGGQSGGALVNDHGQLIGISGASLDEAFALAISSADVLSRLDRLRDGGDEWLSLPDEGSLTGSVEATYAAAITPIEMLAAAEDGLVTVELAADGGDIDDIGMYVYLEDGTSFVTSNVYEGDWSDEWYPGSDIPGDVPPGDSDDIDPDITTPDDTAPDDTAPDDTAPDEDPDDDPDDTDDWSLPGETVIEPTAPGTYEFDVPADLRGWIEIVRLDDGSPLDVSWSSSRELAALPDPDGEQELEVGDDVTGILEPLELHDVFTIDLDEGDEILITATTGSSDVAFTVLEPGEEEGWDSFFVDDSFIGIGGLDAEATFTASESGEHRIVLVDNYGQGAYRLTVTPG